MINIILLVLLNILTALLFWMLDAHYEWSKMRYIKLSTGGSIKLKGAVCDGVGIDASESESGEVHLENCVIIGRSRGYGVSLRSK